MAKRYKPRGLGGKGSGNDERPTDDKVGYRKPPISGRFKKGQSGNPNGRPKGARNLNTVVPEILNRKVRVREGNRVRNVSVLEAIGLSASNKAMQGDAKASALLTQWLRTLGLPEEIKSENSESLTTNDAELIEDFLRRYRDASEDTDD